MASAVMVTCVGFDHVASAGPGMLSTAYLMKTFRDLQIEDESEQLILG